jgi:peptide/nickel transport system permease protein
VADIIAERLPMTIELAIGAMIFSTIGGVGLGLVAALKRNSAADVLTMIGANIGVSMPVFWLGLMLAYIFALLLPTIFASIFGGTPTSIFEPSGRLSADLTLVDLIRYWGLGEITGLPRFIVIFLSRSTFFSAIATGNLRLLGNALWHLVLPSVAVGTIPMAVIARMTRSSLLDVLGQDYIRTARAKGLIERLVIARHAMRNALVPIVTIIGLETGALLSGAVLTETVFALPGVGTALVSSILARDYPVVQGFTVVIAIIFVLVNLAVDVSYAYLDPRIRLE